MEPGLRIRRRQLIQILGQKQIARGTHQVNVTASGLCGRHVRCPNHLVDPGLVHLGIAAIAAQQWYRHAGNAGQQYLVDGFLQHVQACDSHHGIDVTADDDLHDHGRTFRNQHAIAHLFGQSAEVGDAAGSTFFAVHAELVIVGRTTFGVFEAVGKQEQSSLGGTDEVVASKRHC